jgi:hypothetical protein
LFLITSNMTAKEAVIKDLSAMVERLEQIKVKCENYVAECTEAINFIQECLELDRYRSFPRELVTEAKALDEEAMRYAEEHPEHVHDDMSCAHNRADTPEPGNCIQCGEPVPFGRNGKPNMYCSTKCNNAYNRARRKAEKNIEPVPPTPEPVPDTPVLCDPKPEHLDNDDPQYLPFTSLYIPEQTEPDPLKAKLAEIAATHPKPVKRPDFKREL